MLKTFFFLMNIEYTHTLKDCKFHIEKIKYFSSIYIVNFKKY